MMYFTAWYGVYKRSEQLLTWSGGGHPPSLLVRAAGGDEPVKMLESSGPMLCVDPTLELAAESCTVEPGDQLYVYSDGVFEIRKKDDEMWTFHEFVELMGAPLTEGQPRIDRLLATTRDLQGSDLFEDDFSMVELTF